MVQSSSVEKLSGLKRRVDIVVPSQDLDQTYNEHLKKVAKTAKIDGFRPGKIPARLIEQRFGTNILIEAAEELMKKHFQTAVEEHQLKIAGIPELTPKQIKRGTDIEYSVEFEIYPEITFADLSQVKVVRQKVELQEKDIDKMLDVVAKQHANWVEVERPAQNGDRVVIDFEGRINNEIFENGSAKDFKIELGSGRMIPGFEEGIVGKKPGEEFEIACKFPADYPRNDLADQSVTFHSKVNKVLEARFPEVNDEFAKELGVENGLTELRQEISKNMQKQIDQVTHDRLKQNVMEKLLELHDFDLPNALIDAEIDHLQQVAKQRMGEQAQDAKIEDLFSRVDFEKQARRRVTLGLLLGEVIKHHQLKVDAQKVREKIEQLASLTPQPEQVVSWYYNNERMRAEVESVVLEDQAVDKLVELMQVEDVVISYEQAVENSASTKEEESE